MLEDIDLYSVINFNFYTLHKYIHIPTSILLVSQQDLLSINNVKGIGIASIFFILNIMLQCDSFKSLQLIFKKL